MPLQVVVIKPLGYRLRIGSQLLYRQPAFLICTDPDLDLATLLQAYINRWEIECHHRDEKSLLGVDQSQVRNPNSVRRLPQLQVRRLQSASAGFDSYFRFPAHGRVSATTEVEAQIHSPLAARSPRLITRSNLRHSDRCQFRWLRQCPLANAKSPKQPLASETLCTLAA
jgi:hypothetical protein